MKQIRKKLRKIFRRLRSIIIRIKYTSYYENLLVNDKVVLAQTYAGSNFSGNIYYILKEMISREEADEMKFYVSATSQKYVEVKNFVKLKFGTKIEVIKIGSNKYLKILASAKYLLNNVAFPTYFIKKEGQIYLNTWHGTPLKGLGRSILDAPNESGNYQRNFLMTDYLIFPNWYTFDHMRDDYMIDNFFEGKYVLTGYPRNSIFYDYSFRDDLRSKYNLNDKEVIMYMPTWRRKDATSDVDIQIVKTIEFLDYMEENLSCNQILYVKLHNLVNSKLDFSSYKKIKIFPSECETSEFLTVTDALITDYSSVMFDYINCNKKIILYTYDYEDYINGRSVYFDIRDLPFPLCFEKEEIIKNLTNLDGIDNYVDEKKKFCEFDELSIPKKLVDLLLYNNKTALKIIDSKKYKNDKKNVLIYTGNLSVGKLTYNLMNSTDVFDLDTNYYFNFYNHRVNKNKMVINEIPRNISYITLQGPRLITLKEAFCYRLYYKFGLKTKVIINNIDNMYIREIKRLYPNMKFDYLINYSGGSTPIINMFSLMDGQKYLFVNRTSIVNKKLIKTLKLRLKEYNKIYVNNTRIIDYLKDKMVSNINTIYYSDDLINFRQFIEKICNEVRK